MDRKYPALDVVRMYSTLTLEHWVTTLRKAAKTGNTEKLIAWRYGLQAGLSDAVAKGINDPSLDFWVIKRCRDIEKVMRFIIRKRNPNPMDDPKHDPTGYVRKAIEAKRKRDRELEMFLMKSNF
jgi:hypothetical protein